MNIHPPSPRLPHPHLEHRNWRAPHVEHHDMDAYAIGVVHKKDRHEPKKGGVARRRRTDRSDSDEGDAMEYGEGERR